MCPLAEPVSPTTECREDPLRFNHVRNKTGVHDDRGWHPDPAVNALWQRLAVPEPSAVAHLQGSLVYHVTNSLARTHFNVDRTAAYGAAALSCRDRLMARWNATQQQHTRTDQKRLYYMSLEFLMGRSLDNAVLNLGLKGEYREALRQLGFCLEELAEEEKDAALGNGGLGRLAACFMDSLATLSYAAWGYGLRYTYGIFRQQILDGGQVEFPDYWLTFDNPWEVPRLDVVYDIRFCGQTGRTVDGRGRTRWTWHGGEIVQAVAYDVPVPGFGTLNCNNLRLWSSKPKRRFDLQSFNEGNYQKSVEEQQRAEHITSVLYPNDNTMAGKELRLKQQYFFVAASLQDIVRRFKKSQTRGWDAFPDSVAIQLNDTHPTLGIAELQRLLVDVEGVDWNEAWTIVTRVYAFTNHTVLPEALEKWPVAMLAALLPRHMAIIYDINLFFLQAVERAFPDDRVRLSRMSIIEESPFQQVRMAHLAIVGSHTVNGVAAIHSDLIRQTCFRDFVDFYGPAKFQNKTNGITPRRWLNQANPALAQLVTRALGHDGWIADLEQLRALEPRANDASFLAEWMAVKRANKVRLARHIEAVCRVALDPDAMFDVQVKRIHEYKRQFMNILGVIHRYLVLKARGPALATASPEDVVPRAVIFGGKAAPGYYVAKLVIRLICAVAEVVNADAATNRRLTVVFVPDYNVSLAEVIVPASDVSQHISTAGTEASGTSNMKFVLNGGLILGTADGANIEIREAIGDENMFVFGCLAEQVDDLRHAQKYRKTPLDGRLAAVIEAVKSGLFGDYEGLAPLFDTLTADGDYYLISHDFASYLDSQERVDRAYVDRTGWARKTVLSTARMGVFSSDRTIREYARDIWHIQPAPV